MKFPKIDNTKFLYQLVSLLFALLLFFYVNYQRLGSTRTTDNKPQAAGSFDDEQNGQDDDAACSQR